jgi:hypothetical protein
MRYGAKGPLVKSQETATLGGEAMCSPRRVSVFAALALTPLGCSSASLSNVPVAAASPAKDDGQSAQGMGGGLSHSAALEELKVARAGFVIDRQRSVRFPLPDAPHWTRVKFFGVESLVGFRYGKEHNAVVAATITHVPEGAPGGACTKSFEDWAMPWVQAFEVEIERDPPRALPWNGRVVDVDVLYARAATLAAREGYAVAYGAYPAWPGACLIVGIAVPAREDEVRAREVRDRFAQEVLPRVQVIAAAEPKERY